MVGISVRIVIEINKFVAPVISKLINQAVYESEYQNFIKLAKVLPLFKTRSKTLPGNYSADFNII